MRSRIAIALFCLLLAHTVTLPAAPPFPRLAEQDPAPGCFLVAQRSLYGPYFARSVVYLLQHDENGTIGLIINRPLDKQVRDVLPGMKNHALGSFPLYNGGPLLPHVMVMLFRGNYHTSLALPIRDGVYASSNTRMLAEMVKTHKPQSELRMFAGQANWAAGQLEQEVDDGSWFVVAGDPDLLFGDTDYLWQRLINQLDPLGIEVSR